MRGLGRWFVGLALIVAWFAGASPASAAPADGNWEFTGTLSAPARSTSNVDVTVSGTIEVTTGLLSAVRTTASCDDTHPPQVTPYLQDVGTSAFTAITNGGLVLTPISAAGSSSVSGSANVAPGTYNLVLRFRCTGGGSWSGNVAATPPVSVSIASVVTTTYVTRACLTTVPVTACTSSGQQVTSVPSGTSVTFAGIIRRTWSDGATTEAAVDGSQSLKRADVNSNSWTTQSSSCAYSTQPTATYQYRCESTYGVHDPVTVTAMAPTSSYFIGLPALNPSTAVKGTMVTASGIIQMLYPDGSQWPAPVGSTYTVQFLPTAGATWANVASGVVATIGNYSTTFALPGTGKVRVAAGSQYSAEVPLTELTATSTYQITAPSLPSSTSPGTTMTVSSAVKALWSDDVYRDAPNGTPATLEFSPSFNPSSPPTSWTTAKSGSVSGGVASFSVIPQSSGFWRVTVGSSSSTSAYVAVDGSAPTSLVTTMTPVAGEKPFAGTESTYLITASLSGYVGTDTATLFLDFGSGKFTKVGTLSGNSLRQRHDAKAPATGGDVTPRFEVRGPGGQVLATSTSAPIFVDYLTGYEIAVSTGTRAVREGENAKVTATAVEISQGGERFDARWSGTVNLQRNLDGQWATIDTIRSARGSTIEFRTPAIGRADYRIQWVDKEVTSPTFRFEVITPTDAMRFSRVSTDEREVESGQSTRIYASLQQRYSDDRYYPVAAGEEVELQVQSGSAWKKVRTLYTRDGGVSATVRPRDSAKYRFVHAQAGTSRVVSIRVVEATPQKLAVDWPDTYYMDEGATFTVSIRTGSGSIWKGQTELKLLYRFYEGEDWTVLDTTTYRGRELTWGWGPGTYDTIYFRVVAPEYGLSSQMGYS